MALGSEIHDCRGMVLIEQIAQAARVADVGLCKAIAWAVKRPWDRLQAGGIRKLIDVDDACIGFVEQMTNHRRADEASAASDENHVAFEPHLKAPCGGLLQSSG